LKNWECKVEEETAVHWFAGAFLVPEDMEILEMGKQRNLLDSRELYLLKHKYGMSMATRI